ncbi:MerR family transcriptional regulator [Pelagibacteraceae bacterium]|nr:MerR family transcriptional regulator [Pelagibacteraceae bacterium]
MEKFINISELTKLLELVNKKTNKPSTHILRFWEKEFKQIKPVIIKNRRYYSVKNIKMIKLIKYLLKDQGMTINGVKKLLQNKINTLDDYVSYGLKAEYYKKELKEKSIKILEKLNNIKKNGKKNSS